MQQQQHKDEMMIAQHNADLAAQSEEAGRRSAEYLATMREQAAKERQEFEVRFKEFALQMQAEREQNGLVLRQALQGVQQANQHKHEEDQRQRNEATQIQSEQLMLLSKAVEQTLQAVAKLAEGKAQALLPTRAAPDGEEIL